MKITTDHLARGAFIYIRQSNVDQLANNHESRLRQYGLADRARALGWTDVTVIDDDLGRSGSGVNRPGFERLLAAICEGRVGAVFAIEASRLARNGRDRLAFFRRVQAIAGGVPTHPRRGPAHRRQHRQAAGAGGAPSPKAPETASGLLWPGAGPSAAKAYPLS